MIIALKIFTLLFLQIAFGFLPLQLFGYFRDKPAWFNLAVAYGLGGYLITIQLFLILFILKLKFNFFVFLSVIALEMSLLLYFISKRGYKINFYFQWPKLEIKKIILILIILLQISFLFFYVLARPTITYDSIAAWSYKAKVLYHQNEISFYKNNFNYLGGGGHINYPWHVPLQQFWWQKFLGEYSDLYVNLIYFFYFVSILIILYYTLVKFIGGFSSLLLIFLLSSMPLFFYHGFNAYADLSLSCYVLLAFVLLLASLKNADNKLLILAGIFFGVAFFVKIEGIIYMIAAILSLLLFYFQIKRQNFFKDFSKFFISIIVPFLPWIFFLVKYDLNISNVESTFGFHPEIFKNLFFSLFISSNWNIWWYIVVIVFLLNIKRVYKEKELLFGWSFLFLSFGGFLVLYLFTTEYQFVLDHTALSRNILTLMPLSVLAVGMTFKKLKL
ncbi:hypothetical protein COV49_03845 [Candidatus Falkowbacteria bacterium CG11_big_fil_rev_8_21_14_0_20_39_10]|uniref:Glycosyltransferase RgtA/B/C/D-like domain-containing protein n=1 Tax=Candidatus Falkowbacteria bacterium CG11_big_fil_rev_8_21_14_0_20_39_10 TaxID=1974570 RepID=A0A2M6K845_9BACT|nr:MAG: hypothetical protein COV49_03845 [Candidatus Falkowbacteria bacterium CG11_big_fil_rev_8_21_14_0_20_39_10]